MDEALAWVMRCPDCMDGEDSDLEIRPVFEAGDFGKEFTPELRAQKIGSAPRWSDSQARRGS